MTPPAKPHQSFANRFDDWIFDSYPVSAEQLALYRILYAGFALFVIGMQDYAWIAQLPDALFLPPFSIAALFSGLPPEPVLHLFEILLFSLYWALLFGWRTRAVSVAITLVGVTAESFHLSFGAITHSRHLFLLLPLVMSFSNWGSALSIDATRRKGAGGTGIETWPITLMSVLLGFAMFTAGFPKLLGGWLDVATPAVREKVFYWYFIEQHRELAGAFIPIDSRVLWELLDWSTVWFEVGFLLAVFRPGALRVFSGFAVVFHTMTILMLHIGFTQQLIVYPLFCMPFVRVDASRLDLLRPLFTPWVAVVLGAGYLALDRAGLPVTLPDVAGWVLSRHLDHPYLLSTLLVHLAALGIAVGFAAARGRAWWASRAASRARSS